MTAIKQESRLAEWLSGLAIPETNVALVDIAICENGDLQAMICTGEWNPDFGYSSRQWYTVPRDLKSYILRHWERIGCRVWTWEYLDNDFWGGNNMTIKEARLAAGLTQKGMSDTLGIPKRTIEDWEGGRRTPPEWVANLVIEKLMQIAEA